MTDNRTQGPARNRTRIDLSADEEVQYWAAELGLSPEELRHAVYAAGNRLDKVLQFLHLR